MADGFDFTGKTVMVFGGTSGINLGIAKAFARHGAKLAVAEFRSATGPFPGSYQSAGISATITGNNVSGVDVGANGLITVTYSGPAVIAGNQLMLKPSFTGGSVTWNCTSGTAGTTVPTKYLPSQCR